MDSIDYYNRYASMYYENTAEVSMEEVLKEFISYLEEDDQILDLGCGSGRDTVYLEESGFIVTPLDGSEELCKLAEIMTGKEVLHLRFEELDFKEVFEGIWACASLLHISEEHIDFVLEKVIQALKPGGILYMSFKYGTFEGFRNHRYFHDYTETTMKQLLDRHPGISLEKMWTSTDVRDDRMEEKWLNVIVRKEEKDVAYGEN